MVENVNRHLDDGEPPIQAALEAARELGGPIVAMTVVLVAVYVPIGFQSGLTGALFTEFAFTLAGAVTVSAIIALTLTPMLSSRILKPVDRVNPNWEGKLVGFIDRRFDEVHRIYTRMLSSSLTRSASPWCSPPSSCAASTSWRPERKANWRRRRMRASC